MVVEDEAVAFFKNQLFWRLSYSGDGRLPVLIFFQRIVEHVQFFDADEELEEDLFLDDLVRSTKLFALVFVDKFELNVLEVGRFDKDNLAFGYQGLQRLEPNIQYCSIIKQWLGLKS